MKISIDFTSLNKRLAESEKSISNTIEKETSKLALSIQKDIRLEWKEDTTESRRRITIETTPTGFTIEAKSPHSQYIDNIDPDIEYVRRPGSKLPPIDNIKKWVIRKNIGEKDEADDIAFLIARKIARDGIKNLKIFYRTRESHRSFIERDLPNKIKKLLK